LAHSKNSDRDLGGKTTSARMDITIGSIIIHSVVTPGDLRNGPHGLRICMRIHALWFVR
jgi:hypothetical protein